MSITAPCYLEGGARVLFGISSAVGVEDLLKAPSRAFEAAELASTLPGAVGVCRHFVPLYRRPV
jgi:hypothetical protein